MKITRRFRSGVARRRARDRRLGGASCCVESDRLSGRRSSLSLRTKEGPRRQRMCASVAFVGVHRANSLTIRSFDLETLDTWVSKVTRLRALCDTTTSLDDEPCDYQ